MSPKLYPHSGIKMKSTLNVGVLFMPRLRDKIIDEPVGSFSDLKQIDISNFSDGICINVLDEGLFRYLKTSTIDDDGINLIKPNTGNGRWIRITPKLKSTPSAVIGFTISDNAGVSSNHDSILALNSSSKVLHLPRLSSTSLASVTGLDGMLAFDTTTKTVKYFSGGSWKTLGAGSGSGGDARLILGEIIFTCFNGQIDNWIKILPKLTIGDSTSGAQKAGVDFKDLFEIIFNNITKPQNANFCPLFNSDGSKNTEPLINKEFSYFWNKKCRLELPNLTGRVIGVAGNASEVGLRKTRSLGSFSDFESGPPAQNTTPEQIPVGIPRVSFKTAIVRTNDIWGEKILLATPPDDKTPEEMIAKSVVTSAEPGADPQEGGDYNLQPTTFLNAYICFKK